MPEAFHESETHMIRTLLFLLALTLACNDDDPTPTPDMAQPDVGTDSDPDSDVEDMTPPVPGAQVFFDPGEGPFSLPFPSDLRLKEDGTYGFRDFAALGSNRIGTLWLDAADDLKTGWGLVSAVYFWFDAPIDPTTLPTEVSSIGLDPLPSVLLIDVDPDSPTFKERLPIECKFTADEGTYHPANQLACLSPFGVLRRANTRYAAVLTSNLKDADGHSVRATEGFQYLLRGNPTTPEAAAYIETQGVLSELGISDEVVAFTVFTTHDPTARHRELYEFYKALPDPVLDSTKPIELMREYDDYIVLKAYYDVPNIQQGPLPYETQPAGNILFDEDGNPDIQYQESIGVLITVPKMPMPEAGFPVLFYMHGSGGKALELLDRGRRDGLEGSAEPDKGPASVIAPYGIAGFAADFALHDTRFPQSPDTTGLKLYNLLGNPRAMVDNFNIAANEVSLHARLMKNLEIPIDELPLNPDHFPDNMVKFDGSAFTSMGHSMGSTIGTPAMTLSNEYAAYIASGAGGLYMEVALETKDPVDLAPLLRQFLRMNRNEDFDRFDIVLNTLQHVFDYADATVHAPHVQAHTHPGVLPKHIYQPVGLQDRYFSPASRASLTTAFEIPLVGDVLEPIAFDYMRWVGRETAMSLPAIAQVEVDGSLYTGAAKQFMPPYEGGGHYITFDLDDAKAIYACFLKTLALRGVPEVRSADQASLENCD